MPEKKPESEENNLLDENELSCSNLTNETNQIDQSNYNSKDSNLKKNNMEIHHPTGGHNPRKLKDYIFEFVMLFIAISAGFFMENFRESVVEHHKEKEYIASLIKDIEEDTASIKQILKHNQRQLKGIDSLLSTLENSAQDRYVNKLYKYTTQYLNTYNGFIPRDITITQLKNSGGLRLISRRYVSDSIVIYYSTFDSYREQENYNLKSIQQILNLECAFLDFSIIRDPKKKLVINDTTKINEFYNLVVLFNSMIQLDNNWIQAYYKRGSSLLKYLKKEYNINE
jgi:hypothetical protein